MFSINQRTNEDDPQSNPHPEVGLLTSGREDRHMATGVHRESVDGCDSCIEETSLFQQRDIEYKTTQNSLEIS